MNLKRTEVMAFVVLAGVAIGWLIWSSGTSRPVDRHTGKRITVAEDILLDARAAGSVPEAIAVLERRREEIEEPSPLDAALAVLRAELADAGKPPPDTHVARDEIREEIADRKRALIDLEEQFDEHLPIEAALALLNRIAADRAIADHVERFFQGDWPGGAKTAGDAPGKLDALAAIAQALADAEGRSVTANEAAEIAEPYFQAGRRRAWLRWLQRGFGAGPSDQDGVMPLANALLSIERQKEAYLVLWADDVRPRGQALWRLRAQVALWLSRPQDEAQALEELLALGIEDERGTRERLVEILRFLGREGEAFRHARALAASGTRAAQEQSVEVALEAGLLDEALAILRKIAESAAAPRPWRERIVRLALDDLRYELAIKELERLARDHPGGHHLDEPAKGYAEHLESLYRLRKRDAKLFEVLKARLLEDLSPERRRATEDEAIYLATRLDRTTEVRRILEVRMANVTDPMAFLKSYWDYEAAGLTGRLEKAIALLLDPGTDTATALALFELVERSVLADRRRSLIETLVERHPQDAAVDARYIALLDKEDPVASAAHYETKAAAHPRDANVVRAWVQRASWIDDPEQQLRARETLRAVAPLELENRRQLADLYESLNRQAEARREWQFLAEKSGPGTDEERRYLGSLLAEGRYEDAVPIARRLGEREDATKEDRDLLLRVLVAAERYEDALPLARERALGARPTEADVDRYLELLIATKRYEAALPMLLERSVRSPEDRRQFFDVLEAMGRTDHLLEVLRDLAEAEGAGWDEKLKLADTLLATNRREQARSIFEQLLAERPTSRIVLLRLAQIELWSGNPARAVEYARRRLDLPGDEESAELRRQRAEVLMLLGEGLWSLEQCWESCTAIRGSVAAFEALRPLSQAELVMLARGRARLGDIDQVRKTFDQLIARSPDNIGLRLDYVDALLAAERGLAARCELERARPIEPSNLRVKEQDAHLLMKEKRYERAIAPLREVLRRKGPSASLYSDLGWAYKETGAWRSALWAWRRSVNLKSNKDLLEAIEDLRFELGPLVNAWGRVRYAGDDTAWRVGAAARVPLRDDRWSVRAGAEWARYEGPAAVAGGATLRDSLGIVSLSGRRRIGRHHHAEAGADAYVDRATGRAVSPWGAVRLAGAEPFRFLRLEAYFNRLWDEPTAAVALGGRRDGVEVEGWHDLSCDWWVSGQLAYSRLTLDRLGNGIRPSDGFAAWRGTVGRRLLQGDTSVSARVDYTGSRLLDDRELEALVPVGRRYDVFTAALSAQRQLGMRVDAELETYAGVNAEDASPLWGFGGVLRIRVCSRLRFRFAAGYGTQARYQDGDSGHVDFELDWTP